MKNKHVLVGLVLTVITALGFAKEPNSEFQVKVLGTQAFSVTIEHAVQDIEVYFLNANGNILFEDSVYTGDRFGRIVEMQDLPNGKYQLKIIDEFSIQVLAVELKQGKVQINIEDSRYYNLPELTRSKAVSIVRMPSITMDPIKMIIDNKTGKLLYSGKVGGSKYDFTLTQIEDDYKLLINSEGLITMKGLNL